MNLSATERRTLSEIAHECTDERDPDYVDNAVTRKLEEAGYLMVYSNRTKMTVTCVGATALS